MRTALAQSSVVLRAGRVWGRDYTPFLSAKGVACVTNIPLDFHTSFHTSWKEKLQLTMSTITLSSLPYEEFVSEFGRLFTDGFDVQDEIAEAVFDSW